MNSITIATVYNFYDNLLKITNRRSTIAIAGSSCLKRFGLIDREINDIDFVVSDDDDELVRTLETWATLSPVPVDKEYAYSYDDKQELGVKHIRFIWMGYKVCIFVCDEDRFRTETKYIQGEDRWYVTVPAILDVKYKYLQNLKPSSPSYVKHREDVKTVEDKRKVRYFHLTDLLEQHRVLWGIDKAI